MHCTVIFVAHKWTQHASYSFHLLLLVINISACIICNGSFMILVLTRALQV